MYFLLFAAALPVVYMVWNKASNKWQLPPPSVFLTAEPKSRQHAVNETFVSAEVVIMMGSLSLLPSLYPQLSVCTHHHYTDLLPFTPVDTFRIMAGAIFEKLDRAALPAPALRAAAGRTSIIIIVLIWSWSWAGAGAGVDLSFDSSLGGSLGRVLWPRPLVPHCPMVPSSSVVPGPRVICSLHLYTFGSDMTQHRTRKSWHFYWQNKRLGRAAAGPALARPGHDGCVKTRHFLHRVSPFCRVTS